MRISVRGDLADLTRHLDERGRKQIPFAAAQAITMTAARVRDELTRDMSTTFKLPVGYTLRAIRQTAATKTDLRATVFVNTDKIGGTPQVKYLAPNIGGGVRGTKPYEVALRAVAALPPSMVTVPASGAKLDAAGNMLRSQIGEILQWFKAHPTKSLTEAARSKIKKGTKRTAGYEYFVGKPGKGPLGIWQRFFFASGTAVRPVLLYVSRAQYAAIYRFEQIATTVVKRDFPLQFQASMAAAIASAR